MANNITILDSTGATKTVSTEEVTTLNGSTVSAQHVQRLGLALRTGTGTVVDVPGDATNGIWVNLKATSLAASASTTDSVTAKIATDAIQNGLTALTPKFAKIAASTSGNNTIVAAVTSKKLRVLAYNFMAAGTVNGKFQSSTTTDLTGLKYCVTNTGICAPFNPVGWFETVSGELLNLNLSAAIAVGGELVYLEV